jgi:hypothetical protein
VLQSASSGKLQLQSSRHSVVPHDLNTHLPKGASALVPIAKSEAVVTILVLHLKLVRHGRTAKPVDGADESFVTIENTTRTHEISINT